MPFNFGQFVPPEQPRQDPWPAIQSSIQHRNVMGQARSAAAAKQNMMDREYDLKEREYQRKSRKDIIDAMEKTVKFEAKFVGPLFSMVGKSGNPEQDAQDYKTTRDMVAAKFTEIYGPAIANHKMQFIPEEYSPEIPQKIVEYYRKHVEDPADYDKLITIGPKGKTRVRARRKTESLEFEPGERTMDQYRADLRRKTQKENRGKESKYTISQQINDAEQYYNKLLESLKTRMAQEYIQDEDYQALHKEIMGNMRKDIRAIRRGREPSYLKESQEEKTTKPKVGKRVVRKGFYKGQRVVQYDDGSIEYHTDTHRRDKKH